MESKSCNRQTNKTKNDDCRPPTTDVSFSMYIQYYAKVPHVNTDQHQTYSITVHTYPYTICYVCFVRANIKASISLQLHALSMKTRDNNLPDTTPTANGLAYIYILRVVVHAVVLFISDIRWKKKKKRGTNV